MNGPQGWKGKFRDMKEVNKSLAQVATLRNRHKASLISVCERNVRRIELFVQFNMAVYQRTTGEASGPHKKWEAANAVLEHWIEKAHTQHVQYLTA